MMTTTTITTMTTTMTTTMIDRLDGSVVVAVAVAVLGLLPGLWLLVAQPVPVAEPEPVAVIEPAPVAETIIETVTPKPIVVDGLDSSIVGVLQEQGFLGRTDESDPSAGELDPAVVAVLADRNVVLRIAEEPVAP